MLLCAALAGFAGCEDPDVTEQLPEYYGKTFATINLLNNTNELNAEVRNTNIGALPVANYNAPLIVSLSKTCKHDVTLTLGPDYSYLKEKSEADGIEYKELPLEALAIDSKVVIPAGASMVEVPISLANFSFAADVDEDEAFLLPCVITAVSDSKVIISKQLPVVYCVAMASKGSVRKFSSVAQIVGSPLDRSGWSYDSNLQNAFDGNTTTFWLMQQLSDNEVVVDLGGVKQLTGLSFSGHPYGKYSVKLEYSVDGTTYEDAGTIDATTGTQSEGDLFAGFYGELKAKYVRMSISSLNGFQHVYEINLYASEFNEPYVYASGSTNNVFTGEILYTSESSSSTLDVNFEAFVSTPATAGYTVNVAYDASAAESYNTANGTDYTVLPSDYLQIENQTLSIPEMAYAAEKAVNVTLTGDLSKLREKTYVAALTLKGDNLKTSVDRGTVYLIINTKELLTYVGEPESGAPIEDRSGWTVLVGPTLNNLRGTTSLNDNNAGTFEGGQGATYTQIDLGEERVLTGMAGIPYAAYYSTSVYSVSVSTDGTNWKILAENDAIEQANMTAFGFYTPQTARYIRFGWVDAFYVELYVFVQ